MEMKSKSKLIIFVALLMAAIGTSVDVNAKEMNVKSTSLIVVSPTINSADSAEDETAALCRNLLIAKLCSCDVKTPKFNWTSIVGMLKNGQIKAKMNNVVSVDNATFVKLLMVLDLYNIKTSYVLFPGFSVLNFEVSNPL